MLKIFELLRLEVVLRSRPQPSINLNWERRKIRECAVRVGLTVEMDDVRSIAWSGKCEVVPTSRANRPPRLGHQARLTGSACPLPAKFGTSAKVPSGCG